MSRNYYQPDRTIYILALIMIVNALSYGVMIPLIYPYSVSFGLSSVGFGLLFASYSLFQFLATPIIGGLSDLYGRKPLLILSTAGTSISLFLFGSAQSIAMLFVARILDGLTGGNNSVAQSVIADTLSGEKRTKAYGYLGAAFGLGFLVGPALGGVMSTMGLSAPFYFASVLSMITTILIWLFLPETVKKENGSQLNRALINNFSRIFKDLKNATSNSALLRFFVIGLLSIAGHQAYQVTWNAYAIEQLNFSVFKIGVIFSFFGVLSLLTQTLIIKKLVSLQIKSTIVLKWALLLALLMSISTYFHFFEPLFIIFSMVYVVFFVLNNPMLLSIVAEKSDQDQYGINLGTHQSFISLGQIIGPVLASLFFFVSIPLGFLVSASLYFFAWLGVRKV